MTHMDLKNLTSLLSKKASTTKYIEILENSLTDIKAEIKLEKGRLMKINQKIIVEQVTMNSSKNKKLKKISW